MITQRCNQYDCPPNRILISLPNQYVWTPSGYINNAIKSLKYLSISPLVLLIFERKRIHCFLFSAALDSFSSVVFFERSFFRIIS